MQRKESDAKLPRPSALRQYADAGWGFVKLHKWNTLRKLPPTPKNPEGKVLKLGKAPMGLAWTQNGVSLKEAVAHANQGFNVGALIPKGWGIIDVDPRNFKGGDDSFERLRRDVGLDLADYAIVRTGSGGWHVFTKLPDGWKGAVKIDAYPGIELKQNGAQVVSAGSIHPDTQAYYEFMESPVTLRETGEAPAKLLELYKFERPLVSGAQGGDTWGTLTCEQVETGLGLLNPDDHREYDDWFGLMCSVHWLSGGEARAQWIDWCSRDPEYADQGEKVAQHWDSLGRGSASAQLVARGGQFFKALKGVGVTAADERFQITPEKCFLDYSPSEIEEDAQRTRAHQEQVREIAVQTGDGIVAKMNEKHFVLAYRGKTVIGAKRRVMIDGQYGYDTYEFQDASSFKLFYANKHVPDGSSYAEYWLAHPRRLTYDGFDFRPDEPVGVYRQDNGDLILNQWTGFAITPKVGDWSLFDDLLRNTICKGDKVKYEYLLNWVALAYQRLKGPIGTAVAVKGKKGSGKTTFWKVFARPFGRAHSFATANMSAVFGDFNGRMHGKMAIGLEEAYFAGSKAAENQLKDLITGPSFGINEKFLPAYEQTNHARIVIITNDDWAVPATEDERRFFVLESADDRIDDHAFWTALNDQMFINGGCEAFFYDMLARDVSKFNAYRDLPRTAELLDQIEITRGALVDWLAEKIQFGALNFGYAWESRKGNFVVPKQEFWEDFKNWQMNSPRGRYDSQIRSQSQFTRELNRVLPHIKVSTGTPPSEYIHAVRTYEARINGKTYQMTNVFVFDSFDALRNQLVNRYGIKFQAIDHEAFDEEFDDFSILDCDEWDII